MKPECEVNAFRVMRACRVEAVITARMKHGRIIMFRLKLAGLIVRFALWVGGFGERDVSIDDHGMLQMDEERRDE